MCRKSRRPIPAALNSGHWHTVGGPGCYGHQAYQDYRSNPLMPPCPFFATAFEAGRRKGKGSRGRSLIIIVSRGPGPLWPSPTPQLLDQWPGLDVFLGWDGARRYHLLECFADHAQRGPGICPLGSPLRERNGAVSHGRSHRQGRERSGRQCRPSSAKSATRPCDRRHRQRAEWRSMSLEASGPHRMISGVRATGLRFLHPGFSQLTHTQHHCLRKFSRVGRGPSSCLRMAK
jgi:hypothetical protein